MNTEQRLEQLEKQMQEILSNQDRQKKQQLTFPLDKATKDILNRDFLMFDKTLEFTSASGQVSPYILVKYRDTSALINVITNLKQFSAATSNVITSSGHGFIDTDEVVLLTTGTLPAPLSTIVTYFIISATANTFKLSLTSGGAEVDITDTGTGDHYVIFFN